MNDLNWDDFRLVKAISDGGGLIGAAASLDVNHSTVFRRLGQIEEAVGLSLFERRKTGYIATPAGEEMASLASRMEEDVTTFSRRLAGREIEPAGEVRVTTSDTLFLDLMVPIFAEFRRKSPAIRLDIVLANQALNLSRRDADVAIRATDSPPETLVGRRVATLAWALYASASAVKAEAARFAPERLYTENWVTLGDSLSHVKAARHVRDHVQPDKIVLKTSAVLGLAESIEADIGIGYLPCFIGDKRPGLLRLDGPNTDYGTGLWILTHPDIKQTPRVRVLMDFCAGEIAKKKKLIEGGGI
jgi:DNA-binding transcriptional LysR family regulator